MTSVTRTRVYTRPGPAFGNVAALKTPIRMESANAAPTFELASPATFPRKLTGHEVPRLMMLFWFGPPFKGARLEAYHSLRRSVGVPIHLVVSGNLKQYLLPGFPLHPAFELLTPVHKSDYLFGYFSQHVGGAFHDIKQPFGNWTPYFDKMEATPEAWLMGSPVERYGIACQEPMAADDPKCLQLRRSRGENTSYWRSVLPEFPTAYINGRYDPFDGTRGACCERVRDGWEHMISCQEHIARPRTALTRDWLRLVHVALDKKLAALNATHYPMARCCMNHENGYPVNWAELKGNTLFPMELKYQSHVYPILPLKPSKAYRSQTEDVPLHAVHVAPKSSPRSQAVFQGASHARGDGYARVDAAPTRRQKQTSNRPSQGAAAADRTYGRTELLPAFRHIATALGAWLAKV